jgi:pilus assembly protein Flp/PilA
MIQFLTIILEGHKAKMDARGASAVEYGLLVAGIAAVIVAAVFLLGPRVDAAFDTVNNQMPAGGGGGGGA